MAFCIKCGAQMKDGEKFCNNCGTPREQINTANQVPPQQMQPQQLPPQQIPPQQIPPQQMQPQNAALQQPAKKKGKSGVIIALSGVVAALAALVVAGVLVLKGVIGGEEPDSPVGGSTKKRGGGTTDVVKEAQVLHVIGEDIAPGDVTGLEYDYAYYSMHHEKDSYTFSVTADGYAYHSDSNAGDPAGIALTEEEWARFLACIDGGQILDIHKTSSSSEPSKKNVPDSGWSRTETLCLSWNGQGEEEAELRFAFADQEHRDMMDALRADLKERPATVAAAGVSGDIPRHYPFPLEAKTINYDAEDYKGMFYYSYDTLPQEGEYLEYEGLRRWVAEKTAGQESKASRSFETGKQEADEQGAFVSLYDDATVYRADSRVLSITEWQSVYSNGSAMFTPVRDKSFVTYNIDPESGEEILLTDVVYDLDRFSELAAQLIIDKYVASYPGSAEESLFEKEKLKENILKILQGNWMYADSVYTWSPAYLGLRLRFFDEIADYDKLQEFWINAGYLWESGIFEITVPYSMAPDLFNPLYTTLPENFFARIETFTDYEIDFGDGVKTLRIEVPAALEEESYYGVRNVLYTGEVRILCGDETVTLTNDEIDPYMNFGTEVFLARDDGDYYLYISQKTAWYMVYTEIYMYEDGRFCNKGGMAPGFETDNHMPLDPKRFYTVILSNIIEDPYAQTLIRAVTENELDNSGHPLHLSYTSPDSVPDYHVITEPEFTLARSVTVSYWDGQGDVVSESGTQTYPEGTRIRITQTDGQSYALFENDVDDKLILLYAVVEGGYPHITEIGGYTLMEALASPY